MNYNASDAEGHPCKTLVEKQISTSLDYLSLKHILEPDLAYVSGLVCNTNILCCFSISGMPISKWMAIFVQLFSGRMHDPGKGTALPVESSRGLH